MVLWAFPQDSERTSHNALPFLSFLCLFLLNSAFRILVQPLHFDPSTTAVAGQTRKRANPNNAPKPLPSLLRKGTYRAVLSSKFIETMWFQMPYHMLKYYWCEYTTVLYRPCKLTIYPGNHFATEDFNVFNASTKLITHLTECLKCVTSEPFQARAVSPKTSLLNFLPSPEFYSIILSWKKQQVSTNVHRHIACCLIWGPNLAAQIAASKDSSLAPRFARALRAKMCKMGTELSHAPSRHRNITASICIWFFRIDALQSCTLFLKPI